MGDICSGSPYITSIGPNGPSTLTHDPITRVIHTPLIRHWEDGSKTGCTVGIGGIKTDGRHKHNTGKNIHKQGASGTTNV